MSQSDPHFRVIEFYSGIGGMHYAFDASGHKGEILKAFDINTTANDVYAHNHGKKQLAQRNIEAVPMELYDSQKADLWLMSPPCQPVRINDYHPHVAKHQLWQISSVVTAELTHFDILFFGDR
ncbi:C-5 cytosine-specific DNA methylase [Podila humilis]|nr:C-5 cytosine-specific DNA methylase [Podila humilis]